MQLTERQTRLLRNTFIDYQQTEEFLKNPLIVSRAQGLYYWDVDGKEYFDAIGGIFVHRLNLILNGLSYAPIGVPPGVSTSRPASLSRRSHSLAAVSSLSSVTTLARPNTRSPTFAAKCASFSVFTVAG